MESRPTFRDKVKKGVYGAICVLALAGSSLGFLYSRTESRGDFEFYGRVLDVTMRSKDAIEAGPAGSFKRNYTEIEVKLKVDERELLAYRHNPGIELGTKAKEILDQAVAEGEGGLVRIIGMKEKAGIRIQELEAEGYRIKFATYPREMFSFSDDGISHISPFRN